MKNKKAELGITTVKIVLVTIMIIALLSITGLVVLNSMQSSVESVDVNSATVYNETVTFNSLGVALASNTQRNCQATVLNVFNYTGNIAIASGNYSITGCVIKNVTAYNGNAQNLYNVTYSYTFNKPYTNYIVNNYTAGNTSFFSQVPTFMILLGVVVLVLIIGLVIVAVSKYFGGGQVQLAFK